MDLDKNIYNSDLLHKVVGPPHKNTKLSADDKLIRLKIHVNECSGIQDLRFYYKACVKGSVNRKLDQASLLLHEKDSMRNEPWSKYPLRKEKPRNKSKDIIKRISSKRFSIEWFVNKLEIPLLNNRDSSKLLRPDIRVSSGCLYPIVQRWSAIRFFVESHLNESKVWSKTRKNWYGYAWRKIIYWIREKCFELKYYALCCCPKKIIISFVIHVIMQE